MSERLTVFIFSLMFAAVLGVSMIIASCADSSSNCASMCGARGVERYVESTNYHRATCECTGAKTSGFEVVP